MYTYIPSFLDSLQKRNRVTDVENDLWLPEGKGGGINWEIKIDIYTLL